MASAKTFLRLLVLLAVYLQVDGINATLRGASYMDCGEGVSVCGVVVLESGYGSGTYSHDEPCVHGLWPQTPTYGSSECVAASSNSTPTELYLCYDDLSFEQHEWEQHGLCAGVNDAGDFFTQLCSITAAPLKVMTSAHDAGEDLDSMADALTSAGYPVYYVDASDNSQIYLSACLTSSGKWVIAATPDFSSTCG